MMKWLREILLLDVKMGLRGWGSEAGMLLPKSGYKTELVVMRSVERRDFKELSVSLGNDQR